MDNATPSQKIPIEALSKDELLNKYKGLLGIAKKAKQAKDELYEENRKLKESLSRSETQKEADKEALMIMKEMLEEFTANKLQLATELAELQRKSKADDEVSEQVNIENESLKRQLNRLTEDNESLLSDIDRMEDQLKKVNLLGLEQKKHLSLLELEVNKLKEAESLNGSLQNQVSVSQAENQAIKDEVHSTKQALDELTLKYESVKEINSVQRKKFNSLKERFVDVYRKLKQLKECKRVLLETQHEYGDAISQWQNEIIQAAGLLCAQMNTLSKENSELQRKLRARRSTEMEKSGTGLNSIQNLETKLLELQQLSERAVAEDQSKSRQLEAEQEENRLLQEKLVALSQPLRESEPLSEMDTLESRRLTQELKDLKALLTENEEQRNSLKLENDMLLSRQGELELKITDANEYKKTLETKDNESEELLQATLKEQSEQISKLCAENEAYSDQVSRLENVETENVELSNKLQQFEVLSEDHERLTNEVKDLAEKLQENKNAHEELLQIRDVIKAMEVEKIELLQQVRQAEQTREKSSENIRSQVEDELHNCRQSYEELLGRFEQKEREHTDLLGEMRELNEALKGRGDVISRQQEKQQELVNELKKNTTKLNQIEEKLNEKLQVIAEKDAQVGEISQEIDQARQKVQEMEAQCARNELQVRSLTEELQSLQLADQSDALSTSTISRAEEISRLRDVDESFEEKYNKLRGLAVKLKRKLQEQTARMSEMEKQQQQTSGGNVNLLKDLEECQKKVGDLQATQEQHQKTIDSLKAENQRYKSSRKQANVLNLEIEAAEKSLSEATFKLAAKTTDLDALTATLATKDNTILQLRKEISLLEEAKASECTHSAELKSQIDLLQTQIKDTVHSKQIVLSERKELEQGHEHLKLELEEVSLQLAQSASKYEVLLNTLKSEKEALERQLIASESTLNAAQSSLKSATSALEDLRVEYLDYKVKAQSVLRKNQNKDASKDRELEEELLALRSSDEQLKTNLHKQMKRIDDSDKQIEMLQEDNETLQRRSQELRNVIEELRTQNENLSSEQRTQLQVQQEMLRNHRQQIENLDSCHAQQMKETESSYLHTIEQLKDEHSKVIRMPTLIGAAAVAASGRGATSASSQEQSKIDFLLMEREDAEGSEEAAEALATMAANRKISNASRGQRSQHDFMPLDELLNAPMNSFETSTTTTIKGRGRHDSGSLDSNLESGPQMLELQVTKERLQIQESRVRHLTALLAENEQDLAKLTQMNDMLKEELRRQERAVEREKHMHNSEYLKNVIFKFLTLNSGDERTHLVPVLNTILKLSRSETEVLNCVAKGQKVSADGSTRSWGNFLPFRSNNN